VANSYEPLIPFNQPPCPKCQEPMKLWRIDFGPGDERIPIFDCPKCDDSAQPFELDPRD
jgi:hypothetical protein